MKTVFIVVAMCLNSLIVRSQTTNIASDYKHIEINSSGNVAYARAVILLHEIYNGTVLNENCAIGTITARRGGTGSMNRLNVAHVHTSSAYTSFSANLISDDDNSFSWRLKTCMYNGKKYIALDIPYAAQQHAVGFQFAGWTKSSAENMKFVIYAVNGVPTNADVLTNIEDYVADRQVSNYVSRFNIMGKVGIGTLNPREELSVNGNIRAKEIKVEATPWPDYVFEETYDLKPLSEVEQFIKIHKHLPDVPSAKQVAADGMAVGEMQKLMMTKIEELTLHLIAKDKEILQLQKQLNALEEKVTINNYVNPI